MLAGRLRLERKRMNREKRVRREEHFVESHVQQHLAQRLRREAGLVGIEVLAALLDLGLKAVDDVMRRDRPGGLN